MPPSTHDPDGTHFTLLGQSGSVDDDRLAELYAYPAGLTRCFVRGNMIASLDGGAATEGKSGGLGGAGDRRVFRTLRELVDVIVVGAGTARAENYSGAQMTLAQRADRQRRGQSEVPPIALVTRSRLGGAAEVIACSAADPAEVDPATMLAALAERGLYRVLCEGGPTLMGTFVDNNLLDELCLTIAPKLVGGSAPRIVAGSGQVLTGLRRAHLISDADGYVYGRYTRVG